MKCEKCGQELAQQQGSSDLILFRAGSYNLSLPKDDANIQVLITLLENMKETKNSLRGANENKRKN